jgi:acylphosphatase
MFRRTYIFTGHVQGVGFRYTAHNVAVAFAVTGFVRNLPDGRVELVLEGEDDQMDALFVQLSQRMEAHIRHTHMTTAPATGEFPHFSIR